MREILLLIERRFLSSRNRV